MSTNFSTNQFESSFLPHKLQNYEVPQQYKQHPSSRKGHTQIITNDRGHIIVPNRRSPTRPWGHFVGTWQAPNKPIQLKVKTKIMSSLQSTGSRPVSAPASIISSHSKSPKATSPAPLQTIEETTEQRTPTGGSQQKNEEGRISAGSELESRLGSSKKPSSKSNSSSRQSDKPGSLPHTPSSSVREGADSTSAGDDRPQAPTPSDHISSQRESHDHGGGLSRTFSAPPSRLSSQASSQQRPHSSASHSSKTGYNTPGSSYRPHSRQVSREGSGIGTSHGFKVYTPLSTAVPDTVASGSTRPHSGVVTTSCSTPNGTNNKGIQCPSN